MGRLKTKMEKIEILHKIEEMIQPLHPPVESFQDSVTRTKFKILISVLLSARTKDAVTQAASNKLFAAADTPQKMALLDEKKIAELISPVGFWEQKAKYIKAIAAILSELAEKCKAHGNTDEADCIPDTFEGLTALPGVGRKTANLVMSLAFGTPSIAVDTHVFRISQRLGWAKGKNPEEIEFQLKTVFPEEYWNRINYTLVGFGQTLCKPVNPLCHLCAITSECLYYQTLISTAKIDKLPKPKSSKKTKK